MNVLQPGMAAERFRKSRIVAFSSGNIYPLMPLRRAVPPSPPPAPVGEYPQSALGARGSNTSESTGPDDILRLNYAIDLRYGVLLDIARKSSRADPSI